MKIKNEKFKLKIDPGVDFLLLNIGKNITFPDDHLIFHEDLPQILDAWGRPSAGIYSSGPFFWLGDYDQCQSISKTMITNQSVQYCRANIHIKAYGMQQHRITLFYGFYNYNIFKLNSKKSFKLKLTQGKIVNHIFELLKFS